MSTERLFGVSARLLAGASVLAMIGVGLALRMSWQQSGQNYGSDGPFGGAGVPFDQRLTLVMLELNYRQLGLQLLLAAALVGAAVLALHRNPSWAQVRQLRWEVLGAGVLALAFVVALIIGNLYVMTAPDAPDFMGPQPLTELAVGNLTTLAASLLMLAAVTLWWLRLEAVDDPGDQAEESDEASDAVGVDDGVPDSVPASRGSSDHLVVEATKDYQHDWSPEDFRRPR